MDAQAKASILKFLDDSIGALPSTYKERYREVREAVHSAPITVGNYSQEPNVLEDPAVKAKMATNVHAQADNSDKLLGQVMQGRDYSTGDQKQPGMTATEALAAREKELVAQIDAEEKVKAEKQAAYTKTMENAKARAEAMRPKPKVDEEASRHIFDRPMTAPNPLKPPYQRLDEIGKPTKNELRDEVTRAIAGNTAHIDLDTATRKVIDAVLQYAEAVKLTKPE